MQVQGKPKEGSHMLVQSTGLGKTVLTSEFAGLEINEENKEFGLKMKIEATEPVHWYITCHLSGEDIRTAIKMAMKPAIILKVLMMAFQKSPSAQVQAAQAESRKNA